MHTLTFSLPARKLPATTIIVGEGALSELRSVLNGCRGGRVALLYDRGVATIAESLASACGGTDLLRLPVESGDASKSLTEVDRIVGLMLDAGCDRTTVLVAVGGGMLTDLGGFVASIFMRGIPSILVPTSALAMVDAAIGGKTAVNAGTRKNMIGNISEPRGVLCDTSLLTDIPMRLLSEGLAEVIKIAAIADEKLFLWLENNLSAVLSRDALALEQCVAKGVEAKLAVVSRDVGDHSVRLFLNFGHTVAHALEAVSSFGISHGEAVSIGVVQEMRLAKFPEAARVEKLLARASLPLEIPDKWKDADKLWLAMQSDKKNADGEVRMAVPSSLGTGTIQPLTHEHFLTLF